MKPSVTYTAPLLTGPDQVTGSLLLDSGDRTSTMSSMALGTKVSKAVEVMPEGLDQKPFITYDPTTDRLTVVTAP